MHTDSLKRNWGLIACFVILLFLVVSEVYWLEVDNSVIIWDQAEHFFVSAQYFRSVQEGTFSLQEIAYTDRIYPPLVQMVAVPFYAVFGLSADIGIAGMNSVFLFILIFSVFGIGKKMMNQKAGVLSAFIVSMFPVIFIESRYFMTDIPLVAMVSLSLFTMLMTDGFRNRKYSLIFGLSLGLGMLTKYSFIFFITGPLVFYLYSSMKISKRKARGYLEILRKVKKTDYLVMVVSGIFFGLFLWMVETISLQNIYFKYPPMFAYPYLFFPLLGISFYSVLWISTAILLRNFTGKKIRDILHKDSYSYLASVFLLLYVRQFYKHIFYIQNFEFNLAFLFLSCFIIIKVYCMRDIFKNILTRKTTRTRGSEKAGLNVLSNFIISITLGVIVSSIWYIPNIGIFYHLKWSIGFNMLSTPYPIQLLREVSVAFIIITILSLAHLLRAEKNKSDIVLLLLLIAIPYLYFSTQTNQQMRYIAPILPAFALIAGISIEKVSFKPIKLTCIGIVIAIGLMQFIYCSYGLGLPDDKNMQLGPYGVTLFGSKITPSTEYWKTNEILEAILNDSAGMLGTIFIIPDNPQVQYPLRLYSIINNLNLDVQVAAWHIPDTYAVLNSQYVLTLKDRKGYWAPIEYDDIIQNAQQTQDVFERHINEFVLIKSVELPDESELLIYRKKELPEPVYQVLKESEALPEHMVQADFAGKVGLIGYSLNHIDNESRVIHIEYYWRCLQRIDKNYTIFVHFTGEDGVKIIFQQDHLPAGGLYQTSEWKPGEIIRESYYIRIPDQVAVGYYNIRIGLWLPETDMRMQVNSDYSDGHDRVIIGNLTVW